MIQLLMSLFEWVVTICERTGLLYTSPTCENRQAQLFLCPANCGCKNSLTRLAEKSRVVKDYGLRSGNTELISNTCIVEGEFVAVFEETATMWSQDEVLEFEKQNAIESDVQKLEFYVSGSNPENQCHLHIVPCEDAELVLSMEITSSLRHSLQSRSEWKGVGQSANHTFCKRHQNVELQFITVQTMQEDDDGNALATVKPHMHHGANDAGR